MSATTASNEYFHILIHFKIPIHGSRGSIEFDLTWDKLTTEIINKYNNYRKFCLEGRKINPFNLRNISICKTSSPAREIVKAPGAKSEIFHLLSIVAKESCRWNYDSKKEDDYKKTGNSYPKVGLGTQAMEIKPDKKRKWQLKFRHILKSVIWYIAPAIAAILAYELGTNVIQATNAEAYLAAIAAAFGFQYYKDIVFEAF